MTRCLTRLAVGCLTLIVTFVPGVCGCKKESDARVSPPSASPAAQIVAPSPTPTPKESPQPATPPPPLPRIAALSEGLEEGWLTIDEVSDPDHTAWVEGRVDDGEKLVIDTENIEQFRLDLSRIKLDWDKRIVLRIDGFNRELTRKNYPRLDYRRTSTGGWRLIDD